jgi:hypothetical protein
MEEYGEQARRDSGRRPGEIIEPVKETEPVILSNSPGEEMEVSDNIQQNTEEMPPPVEENTEFEVSEEPPPEREIIKEPEPVPERRLEPIAVASDVIKSALNSADLGINARSVELVNGRLSGGKNSVRVNFLTQSIDLIDDKFVAICAVIYHLNSEKNTVDSVVGIAEDQQVNLLAIFQSDMSDIAAWMRNEISRAEWFSRISRKIL